jgi:hypothetical protein
LFVLRRLEVLMNIDYEGIFDNELMTFDMYFASIVSMQVHPGAGTKEHKALSIEESKNMAIEMLKIRRKASINNSKLREVSVCHGA